MTRRVGKVLARGAAIAAGLIVLGLFGIAVAVGMVYLATEGIRWFQ